MCDADAKLRNVPLQVREPERSVGAAARRAAVQQVPARTVLLAAVSEPRTGRRTRPLARNTQPGDSAIEGLDQHQRHSKESQLEANERAHT